MSPRQAKREHTSQDFLDWKEFFNWERGHKEKWEFYLAQIAYEIWATKHEHDPKTITLNNFLLDLTVEEPKKKPEEPVLSDFERKKQATAKSKAGWSGLFGLKNVRRR